MCLGHDLSVRLDRYLLFDRINRPYLEWQLDQFRPLLGQRILEVGCGVGGIVDLLGQRERIVGIDVETDVLEYAARRFAHRPECRFIHADIARLAPELHADLQSEAFDSIVCINVLEHIRDDINALQVMESLLVPKGILALLMPAHLGLYGPYDRLDGHYRRYTRPYLRTILGWTRLRPLRMRYFTMIGAAGWWVQYKLLKRSIHGSGQFGIMNRLIPMMRPVERLLPPPFGLSLIAIGCNYWVGVTQLSVFCRRAVGLPASRGSSRRHSTRH